MASKKMIIVTTVVIALIVVTIGALALSNNNSNEGSYSVYSFSLNEYNCDYFTFQVDGNELDVESPISSGSTITVSGGSNWEYDSTDGFVCTIGGYQYSVEIIITGTIGTPSIVGDVPTISLNDVEDNISITINCIGITET